MRTRAAWWQVFGTVCYLLVFAQDVAAENGKCGPTSPGGNFTYEKALLKCLMADYDRAVRPARHPREPMNVTVNVLLTQIVKLDEKEQTLHTNLWLYKGWFDFQLQWDPTEYGGLEQIAIPVEKIWLPDVILTNNADVTYSFVWDKLAIVTHKGNVSWLPHARLSSFCSLDLAKFPFDTQTCSLLFSAWTYDRDRLRLLIPKNASREFLYEGKEWRIIANDATVTSFKYPPDKDEARFYDFVIYTLRLKRVGLFHATMLVAPTVLLAVLTMFIFFLPPQSGERLIFGVGILISLTVFISVVDEFLPTEINTLPVILTYLLFDYTMTSFSLLLSILVLNCHHRDSRKNRVPNWARAIFLNRLRVLFCIKGDSYNALPTDSNATFSVAGSMDGATELNADEPLPRSPTMALEKVLDEIRRYLRMLTRAPPGGAMQRPQTEPGMMSHQQLIVNEWKQLALVIDRLMFWTYAAIFILVTIVVYSH